MTFEKAVKIIIRLEGGYSNHSKDPGGETQFGISKRQYPGIDIKNLTKEQAAEIYLSDYWKPLKLDELPEQLRLPLFDGGVNQGVRGTVERLQHTLGIEITGAMDLKTMSTIKEKNPVSIRNDFMMRRFFHYTKLQTWPTFGAGWAKRLLDIALNIEE